MIRIQSHIDKAIKKLERAEKSQIPFALSLAINETSKQGLEDIKAEMSDVFDNPVRWTLNAFYVKRSNKRNLVAVIQRKDAQRGRHYLKTQSRGGNRPQTGQEKYLGSAIRGKAALRTAVPTSSARKTAAGNWSRAQQTKVLGAIKSGGATGKPKGASARGGSRSGFFVVGQGKRLSPGVYERRGKNKLSKILHLTSKPAQYKDRLDIVKVVRGTVARRFDVNFRTALKRALATAR